MGKNKKNKGGNQSKADKNLEALKKAKAAVTINETEATNPPVEQKEETQPEVKAPAAALAEIKKEEKSSQKTLRKTPLGTSSYETFCLCEKADFVERTKTECFINDKGVEMVKVSFTNKDDKSISEHTFGFVAVKKESFPSFYQDCKLEFTRLKDAAKVEKAVSKSLAKDKAKASQQNKSKVKEKVEDEVIVPEVVVEVEEVKQTKTITATSNNTVHTQSVTKPLTMAMAVGKLDTGERITPTDTVQLMGMLERNYKNRPGALPQEMEKAVDETFDLMAMTMIIKWHSQLSADCAELGVRVNKDMFDQLSEKFGQYFNVKLLSSPVKDSTQLDIDFEKTMENASPIVKESIKQEQTVKEVEILPEYKPEMTDEEIESAIRSILSMKNGMQVNMNNTIDFARKAFNMEKEEPHQVIIKIINILKDRPVVMFTGIGNAVVGALTKTNSPFAAHSWMKQKVCGNIPETQIAKMVQLFISLGLENNKKSDKEIDLHIALFNALNNNLNDDLINRIIKAGKEADENKREVLLASTKKLSETKIDAFKTINYVKMAYGSGMTEKLIKAKLQEISKLYSKQPINKLEKYVEKSVYAKDKK